jgi:peptide/nickel transport system permease protein
MRRPSAGSGARLGGRRGRRTAIGAVLGLLVFAALALIVIRVRATLAACRSARSCADRVGPRAIRGAPCWPRSAVVFVLAGIVLSLSREYHVFGTDRVGNDLLFVVLKSIRTALVIGTMSTLVTMPIAVGLGIVAGYLRGWIDEAIQYVYTVINSIPYVLLIASAVLILVVFIDNHPRHVRNLGRAHRRALFFLCVIPRDDELDRSLPADPRRGDQAARGRVHPGGAGVRRRRRRILSGAPAANVMHLILISMVINFSGLGAGEAVLSYVGSASIRRCRVSAR